MGAALTGKTVRWPGSLDTPHTFSYLPDMARALATLGERAEADGGISWAFLDLVSEERGRRVTAGVTFRRTLRIVGLFLPFIRELAETVYQFEGTFVSDATKFERSFGPFGPTPHPEAVAHTVAWFRERRG